MAQESVTARAVLKGVLAIELTALAAAILYGVSIQWHNDATQLGPFGPLPTLMIVAVPSLIVLQQGIMQWVAKGRPLTEHFRETDSWRFADVARGVREDVSAHFDGLPIAVRYAAPTLVLLALTYSEARGLFDPRHTDRQLWSHFYDEHPPFEELLRGARYGAAGAYTYTVLTLGQRTFRRDVTVGLAVWCVVTLAAGPLLGATLARLWQLGSGPTDGWERGLLFFVAGLAPRHVTTWIKETAERLWMGAKDTASNPARALPLTNVRGIDRQEAERLAEEGIFDAAGLALADPLRLLKNTPYDLRQIVGWMDEAMLMLALPKDWEALENAGITGAIDLAWYADDSDRDAAIGKLADATMLTAKKDLLIMVSVRLAEDAQVRLLWTLWQGMDDTDQKTDDRSLRQGEEVKATS